MTRNCEICNIAFEYQKNERRFCGIRCRNTHLARQQVKDSVECANCKKTFAISPVRRKRAINVCCSSKCAKKMVKAIPNLTCGVCTKMFHRPKSHQSETMYCGKECMIVAKKPPERKCERCGNIIIGKGKKYCGMDCAAAERTGPKNYNWQGGEPLFTCMGCGKVVPKPPGNKGVVCSMSCYGKVKTKIVRGSNQPRGKGGKREDLGNLYVRSTWEANWARYLNWLVEAGQITKWEYEPDTFEFVGIKRGTRFYTPDFKVYEKNGDVEYHEVKGYMDDASRTRMRRMSKYHPTVKVKIIDREVYRAVSKKISAAIPHWERNPKKGPWG